MTVSDIERKFNSYRMKNATSRLFTSAITGDILMSFVLFGKKHAAFK